MKRRRRIEVITYRRRLTVTEECEKPYTVEPPLDPIGTEHIRPQELEVVKSLATNVAPKEKASLFSSVRLRNLLDLRGWLHTGQRR